MSRLSPRLSSRLSSRGLSAATLALVVTLASTSALAEPAHTPTAAPRPLDTIHLKSGAVVRGYVIELVPDDHVTIVVRGEDLALTWWEVERVDLADAPVDVPPPKPSREPGPLVRVHVTSKSPVVLYRRPAGGTELIRACESPCDVDLPLGDTYRIGGSGTKELKLEGRPGQRVELTVDGTSWVGFAVGTLLTIAGGACAYFGVLSLASSGVNRSRGMREEGLGASVVGAALMGTGFYVAFRSMETDFLQRPAGPRKDAFVRTPAWRATSEAVLPRVTYPVFFEKTF